MKKHIFLNIFLIVLSAKYLYSAELKAPETITIEQAIRIALQSNRSLINSLAALQSQQLSIEVSDSVFDTKIRPTTKIGINSDNDEFNSGVILEKKFKTGINAALYPGISKSGDMFSGNIGLSLGIPLLRGLGKEITLDGVNQAQFYFRSVQRANYMTKVNVVLDTVGAVYDIIKQKELVRLYESQAKQLESHAALAKVKEKVGLASRIDIFRAEIRIKDAKEKITRAKESLGNSEDRLKLILSFPLERAVNVSAPLESEQIRISTDEAIEIALNHRIDLEQAKDQIVESKRRVAIAEHNLLPQLDLVMNYDRLGYADEIGRSMNLNESRWGLYFQSSTDMSRTSEKISHKLSLIQVQSSELNFQIRQDDIRREVRRQLDALSKSQERIIIREEQIGNAEGKLEIARIKFNHGMADNYNVIEAETELGQARSDLLSVKTDYITDTYRLRSVLGTLIER